MKKILVTVFAMNLTAGFLTGAAEAKVTCNVKNQEEKLAAKLKSEVLQSLAGLKESRGIEIAPGSLKVAVGLAEYTRVLRRANNWPIMEISGSFRSKRGTAFKIRSNGNYPEGTILFEPHLDNQGFDSEGNAINGHCVMRADDASFLIQNKDTGQTVAEIGLSKEIPIQ